MFEKIYQATLERNQAEADLRLEKDKSEKLLLNILPLAIAEKLKKIRGVLPIALKKPQFYLPI